MTAGWDTETFLIRPAQLAPPMVCYTLRTSEGRWLYHARPEMMPRGPIGTGTPPAKTAREAFIWTLETQDPAVGLNTAYDLGVCANEWPDLYPLIFKALDEDRVIDVGLCQQLIDNAKGRLKYWNLMGGYSLNAIEKRVLGRNREEQKKGANAWRLRYRELYDVYLHDWPQEAVDYALEDSDGGFEIFEKQWNSDDQKFLKDAPAQQRAAFALHLMVCWGVMTDEKQIERLLQLAEVKYWQLSESLVNAGLVRGDNVSKKLRWTRDTKAAKRRMQEVCKEAGIPVKLTDTGFKLFMKRLDAVPKEKKNDYEPEMLLTAEEMLEYTSVDEDACKESGDEILLEYSLRSQLHSVINTHVPDLLKGIETPIQPRYTTMVESGRTACSKSRSEDGKKKSRSPTNGFQFQNPKRSFMWIPPGQTVKPPKSVPLFPVGVGIRECFIARPGKLFADNDYAGLELHTGAQVCWDTVGLSKLGEALNAGIDPHLDFASALMGISYEEARHRKHESAVKQHRQYAKCFHPDTEVLTRDGWVKICELQSGIEIVSAKFSDGGKTTFEWETPKLTTRVADELVHLKNENIDLKVTPDHRMAAWSWRERNPLSGARDSVSGRMKSQGGKQNDKMLRHEICLPEELGQKRAWPSAGTLHEGEGYIPEHLLRLSIAVQADGSYVKGGAIRFGFTKKRKIERMRLLLRGVEHTENVNALGVTTFYVLANEGREIREHLDEDKTLPWSWLQLSLHCRKIILDEARHWDSHIIPKGRGSWHYASVIRKNVDVLHAIASITGMKSSVRVEPRGEYVDSYTLRVKNRANTRGGNVETRRLSWGREVFCVTVPSDAILVRSGGKTVITHQCANFGLPGGLGWRGLIGFARGYGVKLDEGEAKKLIDDWFEKYPEWRLYFRWIRDQLQTRIVKSKDGKESIETTTGDFEQLYVGRIRGRCRYTEAANSMFQGLGADVAKRALYEVQKRSYVLHEGPDSILYGVRTVGFIHDEILAEVEEEREMAHKQAFQLAEVMVREGNVLLPNYPVRCVPALSKRWCKEAEAVFDKEGLLLPYDLARDGRWEAYYDRKANEKVKWV